MRLSTHSLKSLSRQGFLCLGVFLISSCTPRNIPSFPDQPYVVATSTIIANLTEEIAGEEIELKSILKPGDDPHVYEPVPQDNIALEKAQLILYNGYNLEPALIRLMNATGIQAQKVAVAETIPPLDKPNQSEKVPDPHVWGSAKNGIIMVEQIRDALIQTSPEDADLFQKNAQELITTLEKLDRWIRSQIETIPPEHRKLVTTHDAFGYYADAYGLMIVGTLIGMSTEEQPSAQTIKGLAEDIKAAQVPAIFAETTINPALMTTVAQESGAKLAEKKLYSDSVGIPGSDAESYIKMLEANTRTIVEALGGQYTPFEE